jgi:hypothetical protein
VNRLLLFAAILIAGTVYAQTVHGVLLPWTTPPAPAGGLTVAGYNVWRAPQVVSGGEIVCGVFRQIATLVKGTSYLDPASGLSVSTGYCYEVVTQDTGGNLSNASNVQLVTTPAAWPVTVLPAVPALSAVKIQ